MRPALAISMLTVLLFSMPGPGQAMELHWRDAHGTTHSLEESRGKPRILHFWASWCPPCRAELPELAAWEKKHPDITFIAVSLDDDIKDAESFLHSSHLSLPALSGDSDRAMQLGIRALPTTIIIGANGKVLARYVGAQPWSSPAFGNHIADSFPSRHRDHFSPSLASAAR
ncbi:MAG TPA: TlpA disulfide reductase family protein [Mariprofundaceae bacterium]|nr:TlpA disulfide reductase family protein [Mariprofundaceae bacterium]